MKITYHGHSCVKIEHGQASVLIDPFLSGNPKFTGSVDWVSQGVTHVVLTHGHDDHVGDTVEICKKSGAMLVAKFELAMYLAGKGVEKVDPTNTGGTVSHGEFDVTFVQAHHSSGTIVDGTPIYLGEPCGLVFHFEDGPTVYHMGDTEIFGDMALINEIHEPDVGIVPIGDRFTMGAKTAALACKKFFDFKTVIPCHYATFPIIDPDADKFMKEADGVNIQVLDIGESIEV